MNRCADCVMYVQRWEFGLVVWCGVVWCGVMRNAGSLHERCVYSVVGNAVVLIKSRVIQVLHCTSKRGVWIGVLWQ